MHRCIVVEMIVIKINIVIPILLSLILLMILIIVLWPVPLLLLEISTIRLISVIPSVVSTTIPPIVIVIPVVTLSTSHLVLIITNFHVASVSVAYYSILLRIFRQSYS